MKSHQQNSWSMSLNTYGVLDGVTVTIDNCGGKKTMTFDEFCGLDYVPHMLKVKYLRRLLLQRIASLQEHGDFVTMCKDAIAKHESLDKAGTNDLVDLLREWDKCNDGDNVNLDQ